jgi:hypothetical protein
VTMLVGRVCVGWVYVYVCAARSGSQSWVSNDAKVQRSDECQSGAAEPFRSWVMLEMTPRLRETRTGTADEREVSVQGSPADHHA